jgi:hypothetical protein
MENHFTKIMKKYFFSSQPLSSFHRIRISKFYLRFYLHDVLDSRASVK